VIARRIDAGIAAGGPKGGLEQFWRCVAGDRKWEGLAPGLRGRMLGNAGDCDTRWRA
jgi:hypothetical protein